VVEHFEEVFARKVMIFDIVVGSFLLADAVVFILARNKLAKKVVQIITAIIIIFVGGVFFLSFLILPSSEALFGPVEIIFLLIDGVLLISFSLKKGEKRL